MLPASEISRRTEANYGFRYSYQYVERSVRNGKLENLEDHRAGPSAQRPVGASHIPHKKTRSEYTLNDDQILFDWLYPYEQAGDAPVNGNKIYMELAEKVCIKGLSHFPRYMAELRPSVSSTHMAVLARSIHKNPTGQISSWWWRAQAGLFAAGTRNNDKTGTNDRKTGAKSINPSTNSIKAGITGIKTSAIGIKASAKTNAATRSCPN